MATNGTAASARPPWQRTRRFQLDGPTRDLDRRVHAIRRDVADIALAGSLFAPHYAEPEILSCGAVTTMLREAPLEASRAVSQLLLGEQFAVLDVGGGWAWGYCLHDHYVGYVPRDTLLSDAAPPTHVVAARDAVLFAEPDFKSPVLAHWPMGTRFAGAEDGDYLTTDAGYLHRRHVRALDRVETDPVAVAERLLGAPYVWGGRAGDGLDCSGLVQLALAACGIAAPRDSDQQLALGRALADDEPLRRGDPVFFPGHVGLMADGDRLIHANSFWMAVTLQPLAEVAAQVAPEHDAPIVARRRIEL